MPHGCTHVAKELLRSMCAAGDVCAATCALGRLCDWAATVQVPEDTRLATTTDRWSYEVLAYHRTGRASSGPVEAINGELAA